MKLPEFNSRNVVAVILACTISAFILVVALGIVFKGAESTPENSKVREAIVLLVVNLAGVLSGWLLRGKDDPAVAGQATKTLEPPKT